MKNWSSLGVTNLLLSVIALLQFVAILQSSPSSKEESSSLARMGAAPSQSNRSSVMNPHDHGDEGEEGNGESQGGFNFQNMAFAAMKCPADGTVSLADAACKGPEANARREYVSKLVSQNLPPRQLFDEIIAKFGEGALTDEALEIRRANRRN